MWFAVSLLFASRHEPDSRREPMWEESIRLVEADTEEDARNKAKALGEAEVVTYETNSEIVTWIFDRVQEIFFLEDLKIEHGVEIFSRFITESTVKHLITPFDD